MIPHSTNPKIQLTSVQKEFLSYCKSSVDLSQEDLYFIITVLETGYYLSHDSHTDERKILNSLVQKHSKEFKQYKRKVKRRKALER